MPPWRGPKLDGSFVVLYLNDEARALVKFVEEPLAARMQSNRSL